MPVRLLVVHGFAVMDGAAARMSAGPAWVAQSLLAAFVPIAASTQ